MILKTRFFISLMISCSLPLLAHGAPPQIGDVKDVRSTGSFFNNLTIELKLIGDEYTEAKAFRCRVSVATDDTGRNLIDPEKHEKTFEDARQFGRQKNAVSVELKNPARRATIVKELTGNIDLYTADRDPESRLVIPMLLSKTKVPLDLPALKKLGISLTVVTSKEVAEAQAAKLGASLQGALVAGLGGSGSDKGLVYRISDPQARLVSYTLADSSGAEIKSNMRSTQDNEMTLYYERPIPPDAQLILAIGTEKSFSSIPFSLKDIPLP